MTENKVGRYISGAAGAIIVLCFFLPWVSVSCAGQPVGELSGLDLASGSQIVPEDLKIYLIPLAGLIVLGLVALVVRRAISEEASAGGQIFTALLAALILWLKWNDMSVESGSLDFMEALTSEATGIRGGNIFTISTEIGLYGTILGLLLVLVGAAVALIISRSSPGYIHDDGYEAATISVASPPLTPLYDDAAQQTGDYFNGAIDSDVGMPPTTAGGPSGDAYVRPSPKTEVLHQEPEALAWLVITEGPRTGHQFRLFENTGIGRDAENEIIIDDTALSGRHARVKLEEGTFYIYDLASTNGTFMSDKTAKDWKKVYREPMEDGDRLKFGRTVLHFMTINTDDDEK